MKWIGGTLIFLAELAMYVGLFLWGFLTFDTFFRWLVGLAVPLFVSVFWSLYLSPKAPKPLAPGLKLALRTALLLAGAAAFYVIGWDVWGTVTVILTVIGTLIGLRWPIERGDRTLNGLDED
jgi:hypothetical protein